MAEKIIEQNEATQIYTQDRLLVDDDGTRGPRKTTIETLLQSTSLSAALINQEAFLGSPLEIAEVRVDTVSNKAGTGAPQFPQGLEANVITALNDTGSMNVEGVTLENGVATASTARASVLEVTRPSSTALYADDTVVIGDSGNSTDLTFDIDNGEVRPVDNTWTLGTTVAAWAAINSHTSVNVVSDARYKSHVGDVDDTVLDAWADVSWRVWQWTKDVETHGRKARQQVGLIAQEVERVFREHDLNAHAFGLISGSTKKNDRMGLRLEQCLALEAAWQRRENDRLRAELRGLDRRLKNLEESA